MNDCFQSCNALERLRQVASQYGVAILSSDGDMTEVEWMADECDWEADILGAGCTWKHLVALLRENKAAWLIPNQVFVTRKWWVADTVRFTDEFQKLATFNVRYSSSSTWSSGDVSLCVRPNSGQLDIDVAVKRLMDLLSRERCYEVTIAGVERWTGARRVFPTSGDTLSSFLTSVDENKCCGRVCFEDARFAETHCQALSHFRGFLSLMRLRLDDRGRSIFEQVSQGLGPTGLALAYMNYDSVVLTNTIHQTRSLKSLQLQPAEGPIRSLRENYGLETVTFFDGRVTDDVWNNILETVKLHPTITKLLFRSVFYKVNGTRAANTREDRIRRTRMILDLLQSNTRLLEVRVDDNYLVDREVMKAEVEPIMKARLCQAGAAALMEEADPSLQLGLLARALSLENATSRFIVVSTCHKLISRAHKSARQRIEGGSVSGRTRKKRSRAEW